MTGDRGGLSAFQVELAQLFFSLPQSSGFLLAGGGALNAQGLAMRATDDLDFFTQRGAGDVTAASEALTRTIEKHDWTVEVVLAAPEFRRLKIDGPERVLVDLAVDSPPTAPATITIAGPTLAASELAVRKTLALFGRAEARDFTDVFMLHQRFDRDDLISRAAELDAGFDLQIFTQSLRAHRRLSDDLFPDIDVPVAHIRAYFDAWAEELTARS